MLTVKNNAHVSELYAFLLLNRFLQNKDVKGLIKNKEVVVGDSPLKGLPDIYTKDKSFGIEVSCVEERHVYDLLGTLYYKHKICAEKFLTANMQFSEERLKRAPVKKREKFGLKVIRNAYQKSSKRNILEALNYVLNKKFSKSYPACEKTYLFLVSDHITKDYVTINDYKEVYLKLCKEKGNKFDGLFVSLNDKLYYIDKEKNTKVLLNKPQVQNVRKQANLKHLEDNLAHSM